MTDRRTEEKKEKKVKLMRRGQEKGWNDGQREVRIEATKKKEWK